jgi:hypothetical protein
MIWLIISQMIFSNNIISINIKIEVMNRKNKNLLDIIPLYSPRTTCNRMKINDERMIADITLNFDKITISLLK